MSGGHGSGGDGKKVGVWGMVVVGFFWVHGGIYGNEAMLMAGPPLYVFIMLGIVPFVYSLPIALIVAELSTAFPEDGGYVVWVREACGQVLGSHHAYWVWVIYVVDAAIYPVLVANYVNTMIPMGETSQGLLAVAIVVLVTAINLLGTDVMVKFNTLLALVSLAPTLVFVFIGLPELEPRRCLVSEGELDSSLLVSWILWLYCGFFSLGTLAGELDSPRRTFLVSIAILFPTVLILNTLPLAVALSLDDVPSHYTAGYFNVLARRLAGTWLDYGFQVGANVCLIGLYNAAALTAERSLFFLINEHYEKDLSALAVRCKQGGRRADVILNYLLSTSKTGVAPLYILFNALIAALLVWAPYTLLVEFSMLLSVPSIFLFMWSFVALRVQQPAVERPFRIPGGIATAVMITVVPIAISISYAAIISTEALIGRPGSRVDKQPLDEDGPEERQPAYQIYSMIGVISFGLLVHAIGGRLSGRRRRVDTIAAAIDARPPAVSNEPSDRDWGGVEGDDTEGETVALNGRQIRGPFSPEVELRTPTQSLTSPTPLSSTMSLLVPSRTNADGYAQVPSKVSDRISAAEES